MTGVRVARISNSGVVPEYRRREQVLRHRYGYDVHLVTPPAFWEGGSLVLASPDRDVPTHIVRIRGRTSNPSLFWYRSGSLRRLLCELKPDIVDIHAEPYSLAAASVLHAMRGVVPQAKICVYSAQNILKRYPLPFQQLEQRTLRAATAAYPCSSEAADVLRAKGFMGSVHVLPLGVTVRQSVERATSSDSLRVGFVGRLEPFKGCEVALRAFAKAATGVDVGLEIVGSGSQRAQLEQWAERLGIAARTVFTGAVSQEEALKRIGRYDVLLAPSLTTPTWKEQFGRVPAQALEAGTPVIASDSGSLPELLNGCAELVREGDVDHLAAVLRRLLCDPSRRAELSACGRRRAVETFSWEAVADGTDRMYRRMLAADS